MPSRGPRRLLAELKHRGVLRTAGLYVIGAWLAIQVAETTFPYLQLEPWTVTAVIVAAVIGFPIVVALSWAFDLTPARMRQLSAEESAADGVPAVSASPFWRLVLPLTVAVAATTGGWLWLRQYAPPPPREDGVLVLPFQVSGAAEYAYLGEGLVDLVARKLEGVTGLRAADPHTSIRMAQADRADGPMDAERARRLAGQAGARHFILGTATEHGGRLALSARLYDAGADDGQPQTASVEGDAAALFELVDRLTSELLVSRFGAVSAQVTRSAARTTSSAAALQHFLRAEQALRAARYDSAMAGFQRSIAEDTAFALAYYRLAVAAVLNHAPGVAESAIAHAREHGSQLGPRDRGLLDAFADLHAGRATEAEAAYRDILEHYPDDLEARVQLGDLLAVHNPLRGRPAGEALPHLDRVARLDPAYICPICTMVNLALSEGDVDAADSLMAVRYPRTPIAAYYAGAAAARGDSATLGLMLGRMAVPAFWQASWVAAFFGNYDNAMRLLTAPRALDQLPERPRVLARLTLADLHVARLRWRTAMAELAHIESVAPRRTMLRRAYLTTLPFVSRPAEEVEAVRNALQSWNPEREHAAEEGVSLVAFLPAIHAYLLGLAHVRLGDFAAAAAEAARLDSIARSEARTLEHDLALTIQAEIALRRDDAESALAHLDSIRAEVPIGALNAVAAGPRRDELADLLTLDHARYLRVVTLLRLERAGEALRWADNGFFRIGGNPLYLPALELVRAEACEATNATARARRLYVAYLEKTGLADADLRGAGDHARERLARLADGIDR